MSRFSNVFATYQLGYGAHADNIIHIVFVQLPKYMHSILIHTHVTLLLESFAKNVAMRF